MKKTVEQLINSGLCKCCRICENTLPMDMFPKRSDRPSRRNECVDCLKVSHKKWLKKNDESLKAKRKDKYLKNRDEINKKSKEYYHGNKEVVLKKQKEYKRKNKDKISLRNKEYRINNSEAIREINRLYYKSDRGLFSGRVNSNKRLALKKSTGDGTVNIDSLKSLFEHQKGICNHCECEIYINAKRGEVGHPNIDHVIPLSKGGKHVIENIQWLCATCNLSKGNRLEIFKDQLK